MKPILSIILFMISFSTFAKMPFPTKDLILSYETGTSYSLRPSKTFITLNKNAELTLIKFRGAIEERKSLGKVDPKTFLEIKAKTETFHLDDILIDQNPNQGYCMDAPLVFISVYINSIEKNIRTVIACHTAKSLNSNTDFLVTFMKKTETQNR